MGGAFARFVEAERGRFILWLPVSMGAAILVYFALPNEPPLWAGMLAVALSGLALAAGWKHPYARFAAALALAASIGFARAEWRTASLPPLAFIPSGIVQLSGNVARIEPMPGGARLTLSAPSIDGTALLRDIRVKVRDSSGLAAGDSVQCYAMLFAPERPAWPGGWDQQRDDFFAGRAASGFALGNVTVLDAPPRSRFDDRLQNLRDAIASNIMAALPERTGAIAVTLLTGDEQVIPPDERQNFITAGLAHILAVAGLHVGIVMGLFFGAARWLLTRHERTALRWPVKSIAALIALAAGGAYALLTGAHLPILRSLAMASLATAGLILGRRAVSLRGLALAALGLMLATPETVLGTSFQMSFSAVLALISGYAAMRRFRWQSRMPRWAAHVAGLAFTSLLAGGASMPFAAYQFQQLQPYWIPANILAVPLTAFWIMPLGLVSLALMPVHAAFPALVAMGWGIGIIVWITGKIASWPDALLPIAPVPSVAILLIAAGLAWLCLWRSPPRLAGIPVIVLGIGLALAARPPDVLVSADAKLIAIRSGPTIFLLRQPKADKFTLEQWRNVWAGAAMADGTCSGDYCQLGRVMYAVRPPEDCGATLLAVSPAMLNGACAGAEIMDRDSVYYSGAEAAWVGRHGVRVWTDRQAQGNRPWVPPYPQL